VCRFVSKYKIGKISQDRVVLTNKTGTNNLALPRILPDDHNRSRENNKESKKGPG
jgi:hypothetical protein